MHNRVSEQSQNYTQSNLHWSCPMFVMLWKYYNIHMATTSFYDHIINLQLHIFIKITTQSPQLRMILLLGGCGFEIWWYVGHYSVCIIWYATFCSSFQQSRSGNEIASSWKTGIQWESQPYFLVFYEGCILFHYKKWAYKKLFSSIASLSWDTCIVLSRNAKTDSTDKARLSRCLQGS